MSYAATHWMVIRAMDEGLSGRALEARVAELLGRPHAPKYTVPLSQSIQAARDAVAERPCNGTKRSRGYRMILAGASDEEIARALRTSKSTVYTTWRPHLSWVAPALAAAQPRDRAKAALVWDKPRTLPPLRRKRRSIWEYVIEALCSGHSELEEIAILASEDPDAPVNMNSLRTVYSTILAARLALEGWSDSTQGNRIARALLAGRGNREAADECQAPITVVSGVRSALRIVDAGRVSLDPTFHLRAADAPAHTFGSQLGAPVPWAPPSPEEEIVPEGRPKGYRRIATDSILAGKTNEEVIADLLDIFPDWKAARSVVPMFRQLLRAEIGNVPTDLDAREARGLPTRQKAAWQRPRKQLERPTTEAAYEAIASGKTNAEVMLELQSKGLTKARSQALVSVHRRSMRKGGVAVITDAEARRQKGLPDRTTEAAVKAGKTLGTLAKDAIRAGKTNDETLKIVLRKFPDAKTKVSTIAWYRASLRKDGEIVPTTRQIRRTRSSPDA